jgi:transposase InsO family protein
MGNGHEGNLELEEELKMPWKTESVVDQRLVFVIEVGQQQESIAELCRRYGISRKTGHKWLKRYQTAGTIEGLKDQTRRPHRSPKRTSSAHEQQVLAVRDEKGWGADKIQYVIAKAGVRLPAITIHRILQRHERIKLESKVRIATKRFVREGCNELAQMDYKGEYPLSGGGKCYPLSLLDDCSRYLLGLWPRAGTDAEGAREVLEPHFRELGVPRELLMDHGSTWYSNNNQHGLTWFSIWLIKQGITLRYSGVHHPQTQGKVERMHGTLKRRTKHRGVPTTRPEWSKWLQQFRDEYNFERPHESLGMKTPAEVYTRDNLRPYQEQPREWEYDDGEVRRLDNQGGFSKYGDWHFVCEALAKERVRVDEFDGRLTVTFRHLTIREIDLRTRRNKSVLLGSEDLN